MISTIIELSNELASQLSSRFLLSNFPKRINGKLRISTMRMFLFLPCKNNDELCFLKKHNYQNIISHILMYCEMTDIIMDMAQAQYTKDEISLISQSFSNAQESLRYSWNTQGLVFEAPEFFIDIVVDSISSFHLQIIDAYMKLSQSIKESPNIDYFLQADSPSYISQYAQYWVAEKFNMKNFDKKILVV